MKQLGLLLILLIAGCGNEPGALERLQSECQVQCKDSEPYIDAWNRCQCYMTPTQCANRCLPLKVIKFNPYANWGAGQCDCGNVTQCEAK